MDTLTIFLDALKSCHFSGEIDTSIPGRLMAATDNSIYQVMPQAILFPQSTADLVSIFKTAAEERFSSLYFTVRGGGTSTNGQSLTDDIVVDCSKYLTNIKELDIDAEWVTVEPGVVLEQLNRYLKPYGYFFPISISSGQAATLGGMVATNAAGQGSMYYGGMLDHVLKLTLVLSDGKLFASELFTKNAIKHYQQQAGIVGNIFNQVEATYAEHGQEIGDAFSNLARGNLGYGLKRVWNQDKTLFNLNSIVIGSEGTLAAIAEIKLKIKKIPSRKAMLVLQHTDFQAALRDGVRLTKAKLEAIEIVDETILRLAKTDILYEKVKPYLDNLHHNIVSLTLVECVGDSEDVINKTMAELSQILVHYPEKTRVHVAPVQESDIPYLWALRKKSVGLLAKTESRRIPVSGIEDTVVPVESLPEYIRELRLLLDGLGLTYGMFGHVDAGCLHVRPALDLNNSDEQALYYVISDKVASLVKRYHGMMWGEHGKGFRSQFVPETLGPRLFKEICKIKQAFDPHNRLNPGKIAVPDGQPKKLINIQTHTTRGDFNRHIAANLFERFEKILHCNGNGNCFNVNDEELMCPSYKVTKNRMHSPKGRATLIREWLRLASEKKHQELQSFSQAVYTALHGCLGCTGCKTECPVQVDIPQFKAKFLAFYYKTNPRTLRTKLIAYSERITIHQSKFPRFYNFLRTNGLSRLITRAFFKLDAVPSLSVPNFTMEARSNKVKYLNVQQAMSTPQKNQIAIIADWITYGLEAPVLISAYRFLNSLGFPAFVLTGLENGESFKLKGYESRFYKIAAERQHALTALAKQGMILLGVEPSLSLALNDLSVKNLPRVMLLQDWLLKTDFNPIPLAPPPREIVLFLHCMEKADSITAGNIWVELFKKFGLTLTLASSGCCGMAGIYGYEQEHVANSKALFKMSWETHVDSGAILLATGYSCRNQIRRLSQNHVFHPIDFLMKRYDMLAQTHVSY